ncbi:MAG: M48 family metalloprotease [Acidobacteria bacterium]|nr:M48 family metalloprotease [Acidobacteriota bacterium]
MTGRREIVLVSESQEIAMGQEADRQVREEYGVVENPALQAYVQGIGQKLAAVSHRPNLQWHFTVVDSPVVNAFALPGGYIYFTRGILAYLGNEAELAGVMGHEIGHVTARHSVRQMTRAQLAQFGLGAASILSPTFGQFGGLAESSLGLLFLRFGRDDERESDSIGVEYAANANYDPREVSNFFEVLGRMAQAQDRETIPGWLSTHPDPPERVKATLAAGQELITKLNLSPEKLIVNRDGHLKQLDGMTVGNDPRQGFTEGARFYHPELQFQIVFPAEWRIENTRSAVIALDPQRGGQMQLRLANAPEGTTARQYAQTLAQRGMVPESSQQTTINGNPAFIGLYAVPAEGVTLAAIAAFIEYRQRLYEVIGVTADYRKYSQTIEESIRSFDRVTEQRILRAQPDRIRLYTAREGDTLTALAARDVNPRVTADDLAVLNRMAANQPITPGRLIKIVARGY